MDLSKLTYRELLEFGVFLQEAANDSLSKAVSQNSEIIENQKQASRQIDQLQSKIIEGNEIQNQMLRNQIEELKIQYEARIATKRFFIIKGILDKIHGINDPIVKAFFTQKYYVDLKVTLKETYAKLIDYSAQGDCNNYMNYIDQLKHWADGIDCSKIYNFEKVAKDYVRLATSFTGRKEPSNKWTLGAIAGGIAFVIAFVCGFIRELFTHNYGFIDFLIFGVVFGLLYMLLTSNDRADLKRQEELAFELENHIGPKLFNEMKTEFPEYFRIRDVINSGQQHFAYA